MPDFPSLVVTWLYTLPSYARMVFIGGALGGVGLAIVVRRLLRQRWSTAILAGILVFIAALALTPVQTHIVKLDMPNR